MKWQQVVATKLQAKAETWEQPGTATEEGQNAGTGWQEDTSIRLRTVNVLINVTFSPDTVMPEGGSWPLKCLRS